MPDAGAPDVGAPDMAPVVAPALAPVVLTLEPLTTLPLSATARISGLPPLPHATRPRVASKLPQHAARRFLISVAPLADRLLGANAGTDNPHFLRRAFAQSRRTAPLRIRSSAVDV